MRLCAVHLVLSQTLGISQHVGSRENSQTSGTFLQNQAKGVPCIITVSPSRTTSILVLICSSPSLRTLSLEPGLDCNDTSICTRYPCSGSSLFPCKLLFGCSHSPYHSIGVGPRTLAFSLAFSLAWRLPSSEAYFYGSGTDLLYVIRRYFALCASLVAVIKCELDWTRRLHGPISQDRFEPVGTYEKVRTCALSATRLLQKHVLLAHVSC